MPIAGMSDGSTELPVTVRYTISWSSEVIDRKFVFSRQAVTKVPYNILRERITVDDTQYSQDKCYLSTPQTFLP
jgi:hypothetical protein